MATHTVGIIFSGATGRIGSTQHLQNALTPIRREGGLALGDDRITPRVKLVGRNAEKLAAVAKTHDIVEWTTDLDAALADPEFSVFFDAAATHARLDLLKRAAPLASTSTPKSRSRHRSKTGWRSSARQRRGA